MFLRYRVSVQQELQMTINYKTNYKKPARLVYNTFRDVHKLTLTVILDVATLLCYRMYNGYDLRLRSPVSTRLK